MNSGEGERHASPHDAPPQWATAPWVVPRPREAGDDIPGSPPAASQAAPQGTQAAGHETPPLTLSWHPATYPPAYPRQYPPQPFPQQPYPQQPYPQQPFPQAASYPQQVYPGYPVYPGTFPPYLPPRKRRWPLWVGLGLVAVLLLCVAPAAFVVSRLPLGADGGGSGDAEAGTGPGKVPSPGPNAPARDRLPWIRSQITTALEAQSAALLRGDEHGFVAPAESRARKLASELERRYTSLAALKVKQYAQRVVGGPTRETGSGGRTEWQVRVQVQHCFVVTACKPDPVTVESRWVETAKGVRMVALDASDDTENGPRPWEVSELRVAVGSRAIVGTTGRYAGRLPTLLKEAEAAARNADQFVLGGDKPDRYRVFVAGPSEWKSWYGGDLPKWSVGFATPISRDRIEVVVNAEQIDLQFFDEVLRHEFGHVATLAHDSGYHDGNFWLVEGIAEYIQENGRPAGGYDGRLLVSRYVREGRFNGKVDVPEPTASTPAWQVGARYGVGYYATRRIGERFGRDKLLRFFSAVIREGRSLDQASTSVLGVAWSNVNADCAKYVRRQAR